MIEIQMKHDKYNLTDSSMSFIIYYESLFVLGKGNKMTTIQKGADYFISNADSLALEIVEGVINRIKLNISEQEKEQAIFMYIDLMVFLGESLIKDEDRVPDSLIAWSKKNAEAQVSSEKNISEIVVRYPPTREIFSEIITRISLELHLSLEENAFILKRINKIMDTSLNETIYAYERLSAEFREKTQREMAELSAPLVPVKEGIAILPLIGNIDYYRTQYIMEHVVSKIAEKQIDHLIADFSGILTINIEIANNLHQIGSMLRLMGVEVISTGMRPELAQTIINSGIVLSPSQVYSSVKQALENIK